MPVARRLVAVLGLALLAAAVAVMLWPLHANGVSGNAFQPHYSDFGRYSYVSLPAHPTHADFVRAGITVPQDVVRDRRLLAAAVAGAGLVLLIAAALLRPARKTTESAGG